MKRIALILLCCAAVAAMTLRSAEAEPTLGIGSKAPALDIEHWIQDGSGRYEPVTDFESGKVYVVEFWATWCGPCIASMPHLAEIQTEYRDRGVQIVSVSDETVEEVEALLKKPHPQAEGSFADVTSAYCLTTDPDRSTHDDYMKAAEQNGIPTSFIVGKSGLIEWIGHPMSMDEPLAAVVDGSWDREAFKEKMQREQEFKQAVQLFAQTAGGGKIDEAAAMLESNLAKAEDEEIKSRWIMIRHQFRLMTGQAGEEDFAFYREQLKEAAGNPTAVLQVANTIQNAVRSGGSVGPLAGEAIEALKKEIEAAPKAYKPIFYNSIAQLYAADKNLDQAIAALEQAVASAEGRQKERLQLSLSELKQTIADQESEEETSEDTE